MFSYFFCDGMKLIQEVIRLPPPLLYVAVIMGLWLVLLSEKPSSTSRVVGQQIAKTSFKLFNFYSYIIFSVSFYDESHDGEESSETEGNGGTASDPELLSSSDSEHDSEVDESDSLEMGSFTRHSYKVLYEPDAEVECITVCDSGRPTSKAREKRPGDEVG